MYFRVRSALVKGCNHPINAFSDFLGLRIPGVIAAPEIGHNPKAKMGKNPKEPGQYSKASWGRALKKTAAARGLTRVLLPAGVADAHALFGEIAKRVGALVPAVNPRRLRRGSGTDRATLTRTLGIKGDAPIPPSDIARVYIEAIQQPAPTYANSHVCAVCQFGPVGYWDECCAHCSDTCSCPEYDSSGNCIDERCNCFLQVDNIDIEGAIARGVDAPPNREH